MLLTTHVCHPSLANDNLSGIAVLTELGALLSEAPRTLLLPSAVHPGDDRLDHVARAQRGSVEQDRRRPGPRVRRRCRAARRTSAAGAAMRSIDRAAAYALPRVDASARVVDFIPWGWDERQFNSPGFDLPVGCLSRSREGEYDEYHSSADDLDFVRPEALEQAVAAVARDPATSSRPTGAT